jgi:hypothetical protein
MYGVFEDLNSAIVLLGVGNYLGVPRFSGRIFDATSSTQEADLGYQAFGIAVDPNMKLLDTSRWNGQITLGRF